MLVWYSITPSLALILMSLLLCVGKYDLTEHTSINCVSAVDGVQFELPQYIRFTDHAQFAVSSPLPPFPCARNEKLNSKHQSDFAPVIIFFVNRYYGHGKHRDFGLRGAV